MLGTPTIIKSMRGRVKHSEPCTADISAIANLFDWSAGRVSCTNTSTPRKGRKRSPINHQYSHGHNIHCCETSAITILQAVQTTTILKLEQDKRYRASTPSPLLTARTGPVRRCDAPVSCFSSMYVRAITLRSTRDRDRRSPVCLANPAAINTCMHRYDWGAREKSEPAYL